MNNLLPPSGILEKGKNFFFWFRYFNAGMDAGKEICFGVERVQEEYGKGMPHPPVGFQVCLISRDLWDVYSYHIDMYAHTNMYTHTYIYIHM